MTRISCMPIFALFCLLLFSRVACILFIFSVCVLPRPDYQNLPVNEDGEVIGKCTITCLRYYLVGSYEYCLSMCKICRNYLILLAHNHLQYSHVHLYISPINLTIFFLTFLNLFSCGDDKADICLHKRKLKIKTDSWEYLRNLSQFSSWIFQNMSSKVDNST